MNKYNLLSIIFILSNAFYINAQSVRDQWFLKQNWKFTKGDFPNASDIKFDDSNWEDISIPHDWAIFGPFDRNYDLQTDAISQNFEKISTTKTGRTGGLPYVGNGWYRTHFSITDSNLTDKKHNS
jgi:beta-galactosidase